MMVKQEAETRAGANYPWSIFPPWEGTQVEGQMDQHRCEGQLTAEGPRTKGSSSFRDPEEHVLGRKVGEG